MAKVFTFILFFFSFALSAQIMTITTTSTNSKWAPSLVVKSGQPLSWKAEASGMTTQIISLPGSETFDLSVPRTSDVLITVTSSDGISGFTEINLSSLEITVLDVSKLLYLIKLSCGDNLIKSLDISKNTVLTGLFCSSNQITSLDVTRNPELKIVSCFSNKIPDLDLTKNTKLTTLSCGSNELKDLDLSKNTNLTILDCSSSESLSGLNIKNGYNTIIESFNTIGCTNLFCIQVDNVAYSTANWNEIDSWTKFNIDCTFINDPPTANDKTYTVPEDQTLTIPPPGVLDNDTDPEEDVLTAVLVSDVSNGSLALNSDGSFTYSPEQDFNGTDIFTYKANDGEYDSNTATVTIEVTPVNDPPVANDKTYTVLEDQILTIPPPGVLDNDTDPEKDVLTAVLVSDVSNGNLSLSSDGSFIYTPEQNFNGTDSFTYKANDGEFVSNTATVTLEVKPVNDPPLANDKTYQVMENDQLTVDPPGILDNDTDPEGDGLKAVLVDDISHGNLILSSDGSFTYTPEQNYHGTDFFTYKANDGQLDSNTATVTIEVILINEPPVAGDNAYDTNENLLLEIDAILGVLSNDTDPDGDSLTAILVSDVNYGDLSLHPDGSFTYLPDDGFSGKDGFIYKANDGYTDSNNAEVMITVIPGRKILIPNAFTPNDDGHNDFFKPEFKGMEKVQFAVFDTWGNLVWSEEGSELTGWNGMIKGEYAENGNYLYVIIAKSVTGEKKEYKGLFTLIR